MLNITFNKKFKTVWSETLKTPGKQFSVVVFVIMHKANVLFRNLSLSTCQCVVMTNNGTYTIREIYELLSDMHFCFKEMYHTCPSILQACKFESLLRIPACICETQLCNVIFHLRFENLNSNIVYIIFIILNQLDGKTIEISSASEELLNHSNSRNNRSLTFHYFLWWLG